MQAENIKTVTEAAGVSVEPYWPGLFAKLFEKKSIADLITNVGAGMFSFAPLCNMARADFITSDDQILVHRNPRAPEEGFHILRLGDWIFERLLSLLDPLSQKVPNEDLLLRLHIEADKSDP